MPITSGSKESNLAHIYMDNATIGYTTRSLHLDPNITAAMHGFVKWFKELG